MNLLLSYFTALFRKYSIHDLNTIATNIYCSDYTVQEAVQIYRLSLNDVKYITECIQKYNEHELYIQQRLRGTL